VLYARASDVGSRFSDYLASFRQWASDADTIYNNSAAKTGGARHIRFVHDASCTISVTEVVLSTTGDDNFGNTVNELQSLGYKLSNRKYLIFMDAKVLCGVGHIYADDRASSSNYNNGNAGAMFARVDSGCWGGQVAAHEHMHNLGAIQKSAPNPSAAGHCTDEYDVMCYVDGSGVTMGYLCAPKATHEALFDCNNDDYFNTNPAPGTYLSNYWNTANSRFLMTGGTTTTPVVTHDAQLVSVSPPPAVTQGTTATVTVAVKNNGSASESISVAPSESPGGFSQTQAVTVAAGATSTVSFSWATTLSTATGTHTFSATATVAGDSNAENNSGTATTTVQAPVSVSNMSVSGMTFTSAAVSGGYQLSGTISIQSGGAAVSDASVSVEYTDPNGSKVSQTASTNTSGVAGFSRNVTATGTYTLTAMTVTKTGYNYDAAANAVTSKGITIASPTTRRCRSRT